MTRTATPAAPALPVNRALVAPPEARPGTPPARRVIVLEFNELCPGLLERWMGDGTLPHFRRLHQQSVCLTTDAVEPPPRLEPWVQWPSVHTGLPYSVHGLEHLGDGRKLKHQGVAELLSNAGVRVGVCGSMNMNYGPLNGYVLPDPWDTAGVAHPAALQGYASALSRLVQESSRAGMSKGDLARFGWFLVRNGLSAGAALGAVAQLVSERRERGLSWRRACVLDRFQYDLFRHLNRRHDVQFATFFCNSTAHFQHYYWRNMEPEAFPVPPPASDAPSLKDAIRTGYARMDVLVGKFLRDYPDACIVLCTALSQQPWTGTTKCTYRPADPAALLAFAGVGLPASAVKPVMAEQFHVECGTPERAAEVAEKLLALRSGDQPLMQAQARGVSVFAGCIVNAYDTDGASVTNARTGESRPFAGLFYRIHTLRSGRHHPDGVLWIRTGTHRVEREKVDLTAVAPTILRHFGVAVPAAMRAAPLPCGLAAARG